MSGAPHNYLPGMSPPQANGLRTQFTAPITNQINPNMQNQMNANMQNQLGANMQNQLGANMPNQLGGNMQNPLGANIQNQLGNPIANQMPVQLASQMGSQMNNPMVPQVPAPLSNPINPAMSGSNPMLGQLNPQYNINSNNALNQLQPSSSLQMQQSAMGGLQHHPMQQPPQQLLQQTPPAVAPTPPAQPQAQQSKEFNTASLCRIGQETVQDIVSRTQEVFQTLKSIQPPNGTSQGTNASNDKKVKVQEQLRTIRVLFKRLRLIYEKCNENCLQGMEYMHIESLIPFKDGMDPKHDEKKNSEAYRMACEESKDVMEQVVLKNRQLKEVIDHLRRIICEINTMLTMRRS